jgi:hypothetical protein
MKLIVHTKYGKFEGKEKPYNEQDYNQMSYTLTQMHKASYLCFDTADGEIYLTKAMIDDCIVELIK